MTVDPKPSSSHKPYAPEDPEQTEWDAVVIGTGMGGGSAGYRLASRGHRVLFLEKGYDLLDENTRVAAREGQSDDESPQDRLRRGWWPERLRGRVGAVALAFHAPMGCGTGGSTTLFAGQLERFHASDFRPRQNFPDVEDSTLPDTWPISYEELLPYYREAERLFRVCGTDDPLLPDPEASLRKPPALGERDQLLFDCFAERGLHPYRCHVSYEFSEGCGECGGEMCPRTQCKGDTTRFCLRPALERHGAKLLTECEVSRIEASAEAVRFVHATWKDRELRIPARTVVLAAGGFMTPAILLRSQSEDWPDGLANSSGLVGRNLMLHSGDFIAIRPPKQVAFSGPMKAISLNDFYVRKGKKLGTLQSVGVTASPGLVLGYLRGQVEKDPTWWLKLARPLFRPVAHAAAFFFRHAGMLATIVEDLPYYDNRVVVDLEDRNGMRFEYTYSEDLRQRNRLLRREIAEAVAPLRTQVLVGGERNLNYGHVCGTCRFGDDPNESVLDRDNRSHDLPNLFVVDSSFFPSSSGTNPSLTISANALRVADAIDKQLNADPSPRRE